jgi:hypothetical protein
MGVSPMIEPLTLPGRFAWSVAMKKGEAPSASPFSSPLSYPPQAVARSLPATFTSLL